MKGLIFGPLGAGKGVQCRKLEKQEGVRHVETGTILRENREMETPYGTPADYIEAGDYVPDEVINEVVEQILRDESRFILDGYPRTMSQVSYLSSITDLSVMVYMHVSDETTLNRLKNRQICSSCNESYHEEYKPPAQTGQCDSCAAPLVERSDDDEEIIRHRIEVYKEKTVPVIEHYSDQLDVISIDAERPHDVVWKELSSAIRPYL
ncbi:nucleoside monophosphate kinase (plasmid) [Halorussus salilacus]|uniref:adenylate kinase family protein n=1 Tax=Halorussus salilacus TaxID=2953750 RepID=UPI0020A1276B|nr:nucleoside monophosphate kinase [Halorussus salilacus]USZ70012.1 nucleoside monophosphate kinase [Halorussus salilacus]